MQTFVLFVMFNMSTRKFILDPIHGTQFRSNRLVLDTLNCLLNLSKNACKVGQTFLKKNAQLIV